MSQKLAGRLKSARNAMYPKVTQRDIAKKFNVTPGAVCLWEKGRTEPSSEVLSELARLYNVSIDWLTGLQDQEIPLVKLQRPPINTVPVVSAKSLLEWRCDLVLELLQTSSAYPPGGAAAILVQSDALTSVCPTGSYAVVSRDLPPVPGSVVLAATGTFPEPFIRRYSEDGLGRLLLADDARWPTVRITPKTRVIGTVVEVTIRKRLVK